MAKQKSKSTLSKADIRTLAEIRLRRRELDQRKKALSNQAQREAVTVLKRRMREASGTAEAKVLAEETHDLRERMELERKQLRIAERNFDKNATPQVREILERAVVPMREEIAAETVAVQRRYDEHGVEADPARDPVVSMMQGRINGLLQRDPLVGLTKGLGARAAWPELPGLEEQIAAAEAELQQQEESK
ncbi:MAG: hypothetical protein V2I43_01015 [Parvularcula sp.]|jgi:hypothetical protein|nr:hypothetical protein [Parvularcula sp.]